MEVKFKKIAFLSISQLLLMPGVLFADLAGTKVPDVDLEIVLGKIANYFFGIVIIACIFVILWAAFNMVTAAGDETKVSNAKKTLLWGIIGVIIAASATGIVGIIKTIFNIA